MLTHQTDHNTHAFRSHGLWHNCPFEELAIGRNGFAFHDEFIHAPVLTAKGAISDHLVVDGDTSTGALATLHHATQPHSVTITTGADDNDQVVLATGNNVGPLINIKKGATRFWFETRVQVPALVEHGLFLGLTDKAVVIGELVADTGVLLSTGNFIGFHVPMHASAMVAAGVYQKASTTAVTVKAAAHTFVADTWVKLGFSFDYRFLKYFVNGAEVGSVDITSTTMSGFPDQDTALQLSLFAKTGAGVAKSTVFDWVACAGNYAA